MGYLYSAQENEKVGPFSSNIVDESEAVGCGLLFQRPDRLGKVIPKCSQFSVIRVITDSVFTLLCATANVLDTSDKVFEMSLTSYSCDS